MTVAPLAPRSLGLAGFDVPSLGLGTVKIGRNAAVRYPEPFDLPDDADVDALLGRALREGVTLLDTAPAYGTAEERIGRFVAAHRDDLIVCTKAGEWFDGTSTFDFSKEGLVRSVEGSLRRLRTGHLDIVLLHSDGNDLDILDSSGAIPALDLLRETGKARAVGISAKTSEGIRRAVELDLDLVMAPYSVFDRSHEGALRAAHAAGVGVLAIKLLGQGHLGGESSAGPAEAIGEVAELPFVDCMIVGTLSQVHLASAAEACRRARTQKSAQ